MRALNLEPLTPASFKPFGDVIAHAGAHRRHDLPAAFAHGTDVASPAMWVNRVKAHGEGPLRVSNLECHPYSAQTLIPLGSGRFIVVVCESGADGDPELSTMRAFVTDGRQGVCYRPAAWHFAFTAMDADADVAVVFASVVTPRGDTRLFDLNPAVELALDVASS